MPSGLTVGSAFVRGARSFYENYNNTIMQEKQLQLQKNKGLIDILLHDLADENRTNDELANIMDEIPGLLGIKNMDQRLSRMFGMHKMDNNKIVANPNEPAQAAQAGTSNSTMLDPNAENVNASAGQAGGLQTSSPLASSINMKGTQATNAIPEGQIRKGELTPAEIKLGLVRKQKEFADASDFKKEAATLRLNYTLQKEILGKGGYTKELPSTFDQDGNYTIRFMNTDGDIITRNLGKVTPEAVRKSQISAGGKSDNSKLGQLTKAQTIIAEYETNNTAHTRPEYEAAKSLVEDFEKTGILKDLQATNLGQGNKGTKPPTPEQTKDDSRQVQQMKLSAQKDYDEAHAEEQAFLTERETLGQQKTAAATESSKAADAFTALQNSNDYAPGSAQWKQAESAAKVALDKYQELEKRYSEVHKKYTLAATKKAGAAQRLNSIGSNNGNGANITLSNTQKATIQKVRVQNPEATNGKSDAEVLMMIKNQK